MLLFEFEIAVRVCPAGELKAGGLPKLSKFTNSGVLMEGEN
jgi:hypothetical protein